MKKRRLPQATRMLALTLCIFTLHATGAPAQDAPPWQKNYQSWRKQTEGQHQGWRVPQQGEQRRLGGVADLFDGGVEPGQYDVRLPFGINFRVNVRDERQRGGEGNQPPRWTTNAIVTLAGNIRQSLYSMRRGARRVRPEVEEQVNVAIERIERVYDLARNGASLSQIRDQASRYDTAWHNLEQQLANQNVGYWMQQRVSQVRQYDDRLHRIMHISPSPGYDRIEAVAIARRLSDQTQQLSENLMEQAQPGYGYGRIARQLSDAHKQAEDLWEAIRRNESYESVVAEYEQYDRIWHDVVQMARNNEQLSRGLWQQGREINQLDARMHEILRVESPIVGGSERMVSAARSLAMSADNLLQFIQNERLQGVQQQSLEREARDVAVNADDFYQWLQNGQRNDQEAQERSREIRQQWTDFDRRVSSVSESRYPELLEMSRQVDQKLRQLQQEISAS